MEEHPMTSRLVPFENQLIVGENVTIQRILARERTAERRSDMADRPRPIRNDQNEHGAAGPCQVRNESKPNFDKYLQGAENAQLLTRKRKGANGHINRRRALPKDPHRKVPSAQQPRQPLPVLPPPFQNGKLYTIKNGGILTAIDAATGELKKSARVTGAIDSYYASPIAAAGKLFLFSEQGKAAVLKPGPEWELLQVNDFEEPIYATPAVADGRLYVRTASALFAIGEK